MNDKIPDIKCDLLIPFIRALPKCVGPVSVVLNLGLADREMGPHVWVSKRA